LLSATSILDSVEVESFEKARFMVARVGVVYGEGCCEVVGYVARRLAR
jgi:hypothetical protein